MTTYRATVVHAPTPHAIEVLPDRLIEVGERGTIDSIGPADPAVTPDTVVSDDAVLVPGMIDTHVHAPQWPQLGTALDRPLDQWLFGHTFPLEARFDDLELATRVWDDLVPSLLALGTTTAVYYGSRHTAATTALAEACVRHGQRAFVGRCALDHPDGAPAWYRDADATASVRESASSIEQIEALTDPLGLVRPIVTPRFIPACTDGALRGLAELATATGTRLQTHCSEGDWEHGHVLARCGTTDANALDSFGLLRPHTVLAHATHVDDDDRALIAARGAGIAHCPLSNVYFADRAFSAMAAIRAGIPVGLGTDIAGGPDPSLFAQCAHAMTAGRRRVDEGDPDALVDTATALWMATKGGADLLGIDAGILAPGATFDAVAIRLPDIAGADDGWDAAVERLVRLARPADIRTVWVAGRRVAGV